jgi:hypothetical protein
MRPTGLEESADLTFSTTIPLTGLVRIWLVNRIYQTHLIGFNQLKLVNWLMNTTWNHIDVIYI